MPRAYESAIVAAPTEVPKKKAYETAIVGNKFGEKMDPDMLAEGLEDMGASVIQGATAQFGDDIADLIDPKLGQALRDSQKESEARSPVATFMAETAAEQANPLLRPGKLIRNAFLAGLKIFGASEDKLSMNTAKNVGGAAILSGIVDKAAKIATIPFSQKPNVMRAKVAGGSTTEFKDTGINDRRQIADRINKFEFFSRRPVEFNVQTMKFEPIKEKVEAGFIQKPTSEILMSRADDAIEKLAQEQEYILKGAKKNAAVKIPEAEIVEAIEKTYNQYAEELIGDPQAREKLEAMAEALYEELYRVRKDGGGTLNEILAGKPIQPSHADPELLWTFKRRLQDKVKNYGKNPHLKSIPIEDDFYRTVAFELNETLSKHIPDKRLRDIGMKQHDLFVVKKDLYNKIGRQQATGLENPPSLLQGRQGSYVAQKAEETLWNDDQAILNRANFVEKANQVTDEFPIIPKMINQAIQGIPREIGKSGVNRSPQSVPNIPEQLLKTKFPRTSEGVLKYKDVFLAKLAQTDENAYHAMKETLEERPDEVSDLLPKMIAMQPNWFERDPYNRVDNKIQDQASKIKAINDTMKRNDKTTTEKIAIIDALNSTGEFLDY